MCFRRQLEQALARIDRLQPSPAFVGPGEPDFGVLENDMADVVSARGDFVEGAYGVLAEMLHVRPLATFGPWVACRRGGWTNHDEGAANRQSGRHRLKPAQSSLLGGAGVIHIASAGAASRSASPGVPLIYPIQDTLGRP